MGIISPSRSEKERDKEPEGRERSRERVFREKCSLYKSEESLAATLF